MYNTSYNRYPHRFLPSALPSPSASIDPSAKDALATALLRYEAYVVQTLGGGRFSGGGGEVKRFTVVFGNFPIPSANVNSCFTFLNAIPQGATNSSRIGLQYRVLGIHIKCRVFTDNTAPVSSVGANALNEFQTSGAPFAPKDTKA